jgi:beta-galactosidase/beta-glucuronidase
VKRVFIACVVLTALTIIGRAQPSTPRAEYPRPQFQRDAWQTLNGRWSFEFDDQNVGLAQKWWTGSHAFARNITVPFCFESPLGGINDRSFHPWVWYRRTADVPAAWKGRRVLLNFGAVDYRAMVWVNGQFVGSHEGGNTPFSFDVTPFADGKALAIVVRAEDPPTDRSIPRGKQYWEPQSRSIFYTRTSGIWQSVWLEAAGETYIETARIVPSNDGTIRVDARIAHPAPDMELAVTVRWKDQVVAAGSARGSIDRLRLAAAVSEPRLWSPASPNLYDLAFELRRGTAVLDRVSSYTGFRSVGTRDGR